MQIFNLDLTRLWRLVILLQDHGEVNVNALELLQVMLHIGHLHMPKIIRFDVLIPQLLQYAQFHAMHLVLADGEHGDLEHVAVQETEAFLRIVHFLRVLFEFRQD